MARYRVLWGVIGYFTFVGYVFEILEVEILDFVEEGGGGGYREEKTLILRIFCRNNMGQ